METKQTTRPEDLADKQKLPGVTVVAAIAAAIVVVALGFAVSQNRGHSDALTPQSAPMARSNGQLVGDKKTPGSLKPTNDVSDVGKQPVSADAIYSGQIGDQK